MTPTEFRAARKQLGLNQQALADHFGVSKSIVQKWEAGAVDVAALAARYMAALMSGYRPDDWPA